MVTDRDNYFERVKDGYSLQRRFKSEANIDVLGRAADALQRMSGPEVKIAREDDQEYFAGLLRVVDKSIQIHADYAPYVSTAILLHRGLE